MTLKGERAVDMSRTAPLKILIHEWASGGLAGADLPRSWRAEGRAMRRSLANDFSAVSDPEVRVGATLGASEPDDPGWWTTLRLDESPDQAALIELARRVDYTLVVAPEANSILADLVRSLEAAGARTLNSDPSAIALAGDKFRLMQRLRERGVPTPESLYLRAGEPLPGDVKFPAVLKPIDGAGSVNTFRLEGPGTDPRPLGCPDDWLLQPFLPGQAMSASYLVGDDGSPWLLGVGKQIVRVESGRFHYCGGTVPEASPAELQILRRALQAVPGLRGFVGIDFLWEPTSGEATVLEINPRTTTSHVGLSKLFPPGRLARAWLAACGAVEVHEEELASLARGLGDQPAIGFSPDGDCFPLKHGGPAR